MTIVAINPATGVELARFDEATPSEIDGALARAHATFRAWRECPLVERCADVMRVGQLLRANRQELAGLATAEMGKLLTEALAEVEKAAGLCDYYASKAEAYLAPRRLDGGHEENWLYYEPLGPILAVMPWNFPYVQVFRFAPAMLVAGNVVVLKHALIVPQCALRIEELFEEAGFPAGAFQTLLVGPAAVEDILSDPRIRGVTLTGSESAGSNVASVAGRELKTSVMELGGSDPFIVLEDADVALTAAAARKSRFSNNGQACINAKRFIVVEECADQFEEALVEQVQTLRVGDPMDPATTLGPLARKEFVHSLREQVEESIDAGARLRTGGFDHPGEGAFVDPIVVTAVTSKMRVFREETFGPVAAVVRVPDEQAAIELANASDYGLGASVWTADVERGRRIALRLESGMVFINDVVVSDVRLPFGGRKRSGYGRELGEWGLREFTEIKSIAVACQPATAQPTIALAPGAIVERGHDRSYRQPGRVNITSVSVQGRSKPARLSSVGSRTVADRRDLLEFARIEDALADIAAGRMVVVVDDEDRENEGDLVMAAEHVTAHDVNFMATHARGWICLALEPKRCDELGLELMASKNENANRTPFTVTIEARHGVTTGISAADRAQTMRVATDPSKSARDIIKGGHVSPLKARPGGVLERAGHTEASVDLARLAGCTPAGVICEILNEDGSMARVDDLRGYCQKHGLKMITIASLIAHRRRHERLIERVVETPMPTSYGSFMAIGYASLLDSKHHLALVRGDVGGTEDVLVRVHSECLTGDVFHSLRCDCGEQLELALRQINREGGVLLYLAQEGRGIGLLNKLRAYKLQDAGLDTVDANLQLGLPTDLREYGIGAQILADLGLTSIRLLTNNPKKIHGLEGYGLRVTEQIPIESPSNAYNVDYLRSKKMRMGHTFRGVA